MLELYLEKSTNSIITINPPQIKTYEMIMKIFLNPNDFLLNF